MLTRRGLFGLAAGGAVAAPTLLKAEQINATAVPLIHGEEPKELLPQVCIHVDGIEGEAHLRRLVQEQVGKTLADYNTQQRRGGFDTLRSRYESRKG